MEDKRALEIIFQGRPHEQIETRSVIKSDPKARLFDTIHTLRLSPRMGTRITDPELANTDYASAISAFEHSTLDTF